MRWLVPLRSVGTRKVLSSWRPYDRSSRLKWQLVCTLSALDLLPCLPGASVHPLALDGFATGLASLGLIGDFVPVIQVGNPASTRKLAAFLLKDGAIEAVVKIPLTLEAEKTVLVEADALQSLTRLGPTIPKLIAVDGYRKWSAQNWIEGLSSPREFTGQHIDFQFQLLNFGKTTSIDEALQGDPSLRDLAAWTLSAPGVVGRAINRISRDIEFVSTAVHGDFVPGNIKINSGRFHVFDWESTWLDGLPLQDICHFFYQEDYLFRDIGRLPDAIFSHPEVSRYLNAFSISETSAMHLVLYYLVKRYFTHLRYREQSACEYDLNQLEIALNDLNCG